LELKFNRRIPLIGVLALMLVALPVIGCTQSSTTNIPTTDAQKPTIKFVDAQWESMWINNAIAKFIIEKGYGYPVETVAVTTPVWQVSMPKGELHVDLELWGQNYPDYMQKVLAEGSIIELGQTYEGGPQFYMIPQWVHEQYNINTIEDMKDNWELFKGAEDPSKGVFVNSIIGWQSTRINEVKLKAYGLTDYYNIIEPGSSGALDAALSGPQKKNQPVFGYYWAPTAIMGMYDWYILEEPAYDAAVWAEIMKAVEDSTLTPVLACAYENIPVTKGIWSGLRQMAPDVVDLLSKMDVGLNQLNETAAWGVQNEIAGDYEKDAVHYLNMYEYKWSTWVTNDAYAKIKLALSSY
jgi:glycine betaine/proline transport system substrate-binding protein